MSGLSRGEAHTILELPIGADLDAIRTSYKRLANKWHPEKHPKSEEAFKLFQKISRAYRRLIEDNDRGPMDAKEMYSLYQQTVYSNDCHNGVMDNYSESDDGDSDSSYDAEDLGPKSRGYHSSKFSDDEDDDEHKSNGLTDEQRQKFANELISEEEKRKKKLEKRRLKKKQRREKKRLEKQTEQIQTVKLQDVPKKNGKVKEEMQVVKESKEQNSSKYDFSTKSDSEELNMNAAFYTQVTKKKKPAMEIEINRSAEIRQPPIRNDEVQDAIIIQSRQFAIDGNTRANNGHFREAVDLFSKAVSLDSTDFRFFGNRSFCYERLEEFDKALADANRAIGIAPDWPKGYFRKGKALVGLKNYTHAEDAFTHVLKLDMKCIDAKHELNEVRIQQLIEMGFTPQLARSAIQQHGTVPQALDSLLAGRVSEMSFDEVYISDVEDAPQSPQGAPPIIAQVTTRLTNSTSSHVERPVIANNSHQKASSITTGSQLKSAPLTNSQKAPLPPIPQHHYEQAQHQILINKQMDNAKMNPRNPEGLTSLWVGNVLPDVSQEDLVRMFSKYGKLQSVKCLPDKFCAFVNFTSKECAGKAMEALQGVDCGGQKLLIKFPDNPLTSGVTNGTEKIVAKTTTKAAPIAAVANANALGNKISGPVNGNECYFWRTTGCQFANSCRYRHVPDHKGVDKKPWHKSK